MPVEPGGRVWAGGGVCTRPVDVDNNFVRNVADHYFIKTDSTESGMGIPGRAANQGDSMSDLFAQTQWVDHTGQSKRPDTKCWTVPNVDEQCVDALIRPGTRTGRWLTWYQCLSHKTH